MWSAPRINTSCSCRILAALCGGGSAVLDRPRSRSWWGARAATDEALFAPAPEAVETDGEVSVRREGVESAEPRQEPVLRRGLISIWPAFRDSE